MTQTNQTNPKYTRELVIAKVKQFFPNESPDKILKILDAYRDNLAERDRVHMAVIKMSEGNVERLRECVDAAIFDFRDVVGAAEYEEDWLMRDPTIPNLNKSKK